MPSQADLGEGCQDIVCEVKVGIFQQDTRDKGIYVCCLDNESFGICEWICFKNGGGVDN